MIQSKNNRNLLKKKKWKGREEIWRKRGELKKKRRSF